MSWRQFGPIHFGCTGRYVSFGLGDFYIGLNWRQNVRVEQEDTFRNAITLNSPNGTLSIQWLSTSHERSGFYKGEEEGVLYASLIIKRLMFAFEYVTKQGREQIRMKYMRNTPGAV